MSVNISQKPRLLLHICCVGCGVYVSQILKQDYEVVLLFYNPNIWPKEEYEKRLAESKKVAAKHDLKLLVGDYDHDAWLKAVSGHEADEEKGERCLICYGLRLEKAVAAAAEHGCECVATTLTTSPHKLAAAINSIGGRLAERRGVKFLISDFKKRDGFKKSAALSRELGLYRQNYCGCEFSRRPTHSL